jgi:hypothetical protein
MASNDARATQQRREIMRALIRSAAAAALTIGIAAFVGGTVTLGAAIATASSAEAKSSNGSKPQRATQLRGRIPLESLRNVEPKKHRVRGIDG